MSHHKVSNGNVKGHDIRVRTANEWRRKIYRELKMAISYSTKFMFIKLLGFFSPSNQHLFTEYIKMSHISQASHLIQPFSLPFKSYPLELILKIATFKCSSQIRYTDQHETLVPSEWMAYLFRITSGELEVYSAR